MPPTDNPIDSFVHIADVHFWEVVLNPLRLLNKRFIGNANVILRRRAQYLAERAGPYADAVAGLGIKPVLMTGDFASTSTAKEFEAGAGLVRGLVERGLEPTLIAGNHDVYTFESLRHRRFEEFLGEWMPAQELPALTTLPGGTPVLWVPTACPNILSSKGRITDDEIARVRELLDQAQEPLIVAGHYPVLERTYGYETNPNRRLRNADALRRVLGESGKRLLYICGHVHRFSYVQDTEYPTMHHLTTGAFIRTAPESDSDGDFSEVHVHADGFRVVRHIHRDDWTASEEAPRSSNETARSSGESA